jgi:hypothetical protein
MLSYTGLRNLFGTLTNDSTSANLTLGDILINDSIRTVYSLRPWAFLEKVETISTVASQQSYEIPNSLKESLTDVYITVGTQIYSPKPIISEIDWKIILESSLGNSDQPCFWYRQDSKVYFSPTPATAGNTITFRGRNKAKDLSISDYTTGTIVTVTNGTTAVVGNGTTWTSSMNGRYIRITESDSLLKGDGQWYEISSVTSNTTLSLTKPYLGTTIAGGAAVYSIGQMSGIPEDYELAPIFRAVAIYYTKEDVTSIGDRFWRMYDGGVEAGISQSYEGIIGRMMNEGKIEGRYFVPSNLTIPDPNWPERELITGI